MFCPNCGKKIPEKSRFCPMCGFNIKEFFNESFKEENDKEKVGIFEEKDEELITSQPIIDEFEEEIIEKEYKANTPIEKEVIKEEAKESKIKNKLESLFASKKEPKDKNFEENHDNIHKNQTNKSYENENLKYEFEEQEDILKETSFKNSEDVNTSENKEENVNAQELKKEAKKDKSEYVKIILETKDKIVDQVIKSQKFLNKKIRKFLYDMILEKNKYKDYLVILTALALFFPIIKSLSILFQSGKMGQNVLVFGLILVITIINLIITALGPFLSLKVLNLNYIKNLDKSTVKSIVLTSTGIIAVVNLVLYLLFGEIISMGVILSSISKSGILSGAMIVATVVSIILKVYILGVIVADKVSKDKYFKVNGSILLGMVLAELLSFLVAAPIISLLIDII